MFVHGALRVYMQRHTHLISYLIAWTSHARVARACTDRVDIDSSSLTETILHGYDLRPAGSTGRQKHLAKRG